MVPETLTVLLVIRQIINLIVLLVILDPFSAPETIDDVLGFRGGEEDDGILVYCCFEAAQAGRKGVSAVRSVEERTYAETGEEMSPSSSRYLYRVLMTLSRRSTLRLCTILRARVSHAIAARLESERVLG